MLGRTHKRLAVATAFAILQPATVPACLGALAAGSIGGTLCDIDILFRNRSASDEDPDRDDHYDGAWEDIASNAILFALFVLVDWLFGNGAVYWFISHLGFHTLAAAAVFALIVVCGMTASHRSYMHSILIGVLLSGCASVVCAPLAPALAIGFFSHLILDLFNKSGICLFWPINKRFCLNLCSATKTVNYVLETVGELLCDLFVSYFLIVAVLNHSQASQILEILRTPYSEGVTNFGAWLIFINIITFVVENINFSRWFKGKWPYQEHDENFNGEKDDVTMSFAQRNIYILFVLGGAIGGLLSYIFFFIRRKKYIKNGALGFIIPAFGALSVVLEWACIYFAIVKPVYALEWIGSNLAGLNIMYLAIYLVALNITTFIVYARDGENTNQLTVGVFFELLIAFIGGAFAALLATNLKGYYSSQKRFKGTVMKMLQAQCLAAIMAFVLLTVGI